MTVRDEMAAFVENQIETLEERYGQFPIRHTETVDGPDRFEGAVAMASDGWRGDAGVLPRDDEGRYLLIRHEKASGEWGVPGGGHEPGERMAETARRECREETGLDCTLTDVISARIKTIRHETESDRTLPMLTVWFEGSTQPGELTSQDDEIVDVAWFEEFPEDLSPVVDRHVREYY